MTNLKNFLKKLSFYAYEISIKKYLRHSKDYNSKFSGKLSVTDTLASKILRLFFYRKKRVFPNIAPHKNIAPPLWYICHDLGL